MCLSVMQLLLALPSRVPSQSRWHSLSKCQRAPGPAGARRGHRNAGLEQPSGAPPGSIRLRPGSGRRPRVMRRARRGWRCTICWPQTAICLAGTRAASCIPICTSFHDSTTSRCLTAGCARRLTPRRTDGPVHGRPGADEHFLVPGDLAERRRRPSHERSFTLARFRAPRAGR